MQKRRRHTLFQYSLSPSMLTSNRPQFVAELFKKLYLDFEIKRLTTTADQLHTNGQVRRYIITFAALLRQYIYIYISDH